MPRQNACNTLEISHLPQQHMLALWCRWHCCITSDSPWQCRKERTVNGYGIIHGKTSDHRNNISRWMHLLIGSSRSVIYKNHYTCRVVLCTIQHTYTFIHCYCLQFELCEFESQFLMKSDRE